MVNVQNFWKGLGDFWTAFENRREVEDFWTGMLGVVEESSKNLHRIFLSPYNVNSQPTWDEVNQEIICIVSGAQMNNLPETNTFNMPSNMAGTYSIPVLSGLETGQILTENVDFTIVDDNKINFTTLPTSGTNMDRVSLIAPTSKRTDSTVFNLYRKMAKLEGVICNQTQYHPFTYNGDPPYPLTQQYKEQKAELIKYMCWGIMYLKKQIPTMENLKKIFNILYNLPFAYEGGTATIIGNICIVGNYTYYVSSEGWSVSNGQTVNRFDYLTNGITLSDRTSDLALIQANFPSLQEACGVVLNVELRNRSAYFESVITDYLTNYFNVTLNLLTTFTSVDAPVYIEYDTGTAGYDFGVYL